MLVILLDAGADPAYQFGRFGIKSSMNFIAATIRCTFIEAIRSRLFVIALIAVLLGLGGAFFLGELAITESNEVRVGIVAALLRLSAVFLLVAFVVSSTTRELHDQLVSFVIAQAIPRWRYLIGKLGGFVCVGAMLAALVGAPLGLFAPADRVLIWTSSLALELTIVAALSLFCSLTLTQFVAAFAAASAFYLLARMMDGIQILVGPLAANTALSDRLMTGFVQALSHLMPGLAHFTQAGWLLEGAVGASTIGPIALQAAIYVVLLGAAALFDFYRQNF